ncbi:YugN-like family protein [Marininema mesophilum]|uniref:YugN-like family protein n=1 Tax=Marininema mesophilum TaxID=1048340 RepID=A0A1H2VPZ3_9BACL|nr:YugN family protein [Marininema mesophilum]SDW70366.1 YugN-like family protein [Marininema mesophilum]
MILTDTGIKGIRGTFGEVEKAMLKAGFVRWSWDYGKANFDMKFSNEESDYYLRIQVHVTQGALESPKARVELDKPIFVRHIFPHGLDDDTAIPEAFQEKIDTAIGAIKEDLS